MFLSQTAEYALRAMAHLSLLPPGEAIRSSDLSRTSGIPAHYVSKILRRLVVAGLLRSQKGHGGGFVLARAADEISFTDVLEAVDYPAGSDHCAFGWGACDDRHPCPLHDHWTWLDREFRKWAATNTLADLTELKPRRRRKNRRR